MSANCLTWDTDKDEDNDNDKEDVGVTNKS